MKSFTLTMLLTVVAVGALILSGCGGNDNPSGGNGNGETTGGGSLVLGAEEAWVHCNRGPAGWLTEGGRCDGMVFTKGGKECLGNGVNNETWVFSEDSGKYSTSGDMLTVTQGGYSETMTYGISGDKLTLTFSNGGSDTYTKTSGVKSETSGGGIGNTAVNKCGVDGTADNCKTVTIGAQTWMAENLNRYLDSDGALSWCYENDPDNCDKYGRLYDWKTAMTVCPAGWHLPTRTEWETLERTVGGLGQDVGNKLKSTTGWADYPDVTATDEYGFSALPGGFYEGAYRFFSNGDFLNVGKDGCWWTATKSSDNGAYGRTMGNGHGFVIGTGNQIYGDNTSWQSVRCVMN